MPPRVSVVMGVYNGAAKLRATIDSLLNQEFREFEFLIVDDGSKDESARLLAEVAAQDARIKVLTQANQGLTVALRNGCAAAQGEFIARQDVGDLSLPRRLSQQVAYFEAHPEVAVVCSWVELVAPGGEFLDLIKFADDPQEMTRQWVELGVAPCHTATMFRRTAYERAGGYRPQFRTAQDHDLWYRMIRFGTLGCCSEALFRWVLDDTGISAQGSGLQQKLAELAKQCYLSQQSGEADTPWLTQAAALSAQAVAQPADHRRQTRNRAMASYFVASQLLARGDLRAIGYLRQTLSHNPRHWKAWLRLAQALLKRNWKPHSH